MVKLPYSGSENQHGFGLFELLIALALFGFASTVLLTQLAISMKQARKDYELSLKILKIEEVRHVD